MGKRRRDPTEEKYNKLEQHWNICKQQQSIARHRKLLDGRHSTGSSRSITSTVEHLINNYSPRGKSSAAGSDQHMVMMFNSKVSENDDMLVELLRDRHSAIQTGKLRRRLFQDTDDDDDNGDYEYEDEISDDESDDADEEEICSDCFDLIINQQSEVEEKSELVSSHAATDHDQNVVNDNDNGSCSSTNAITINSSVVVISGYQGELKEKENVETINGGRVKKILLRALMAWLCIVLVVFVLWMSCYALFYMFREEGVGVFLVPT